MATGDGIYTGFVIPSETATNPVQVWVPTLDKYTPIGDWKTCGKNTLNAIGSNELSIMRTKARWYYLTQELDGGNYWYDQSIGAGTTEQLLPSDKALTSMPDCSQSMNHNFTHNGRAEGKSFLSHFSEPCENMCVNYVLDRSRGTVIDTNPNKQNGTFVSMTQWQKVLVSMIDGGAVGTILRVLPWPDDYNDVLQSR